MARVSLRFCMQSGLRRKNERDAATPIAAVRDPSNPGNQSVRSLFYLSASPLAEQLSHRLDQIRSAAGKTGLSGGNLPTARIQRKVAIVIEIHFIDVGASFARLAKSQHLQLQQNCDDEVIVRMKRVDLRRCQVRIRKRLGARNPMSRLCDVDLASRATHVCHFAIADGYDKSSQFQRPCSVP